MPKPSPPRRKAAPTPVPAATPAGEAMPLDHATAYALRDVANLHGMTDRDAAAYAIKLWHWIAGQVQQGKILCMADGRDGEVRKVELPAPKPAAEVT